MGTFWQHVLQIVLASIFDAFSMRLNLAFLILVEAKMHFSHFRHGRCWHRFWLPKLSQNGPKMFPRRSQEGPKGFSKSYEKCMLFGRVKKSKKVTLESLGGPFCRNMAPKRGPKRLPKSTENLPHIDSLWNSLLGGLWDPQKSSKMVPDLSKIIPNRFQVLMFFFGCFVNFSLHVFTSF